jgi:hypothetical protein
MTICRATNKVRHRGQDSALAQAVRFEAGRLPRDRPMNVYRCARCGDWHVGHRPKARSAMVAAPAPEPSETPARCEANCKKAATTTVWTPRGEMRVCGKHATRLRAVYQPVAASVQRETAKAGVHRPAEVLRRG